MARSDKKKKIKRQFSPEGNIIKNIVTPDAYYKEHPAWNFVSCDKEMWSIQSERVKSIFWQEIFPKLQEWEKLTWSDILVDSKKQNHKIDVLKLNACAITRLTELRIEADAVISLRLNGTHRIYGIITQSIFSILWVDLDHGNNDTCVCKSRLKHT